MTLNQIRKWATKPGVDKREESKRDGEGEEERRVFEVTHQTLSI